MAITHYLSLILGEDQDIFAFPRVHHMKGDIRLLAGL
jgi:hypothetical protein